MPKVATAPEQALPSGTGPAFFHNGQGPRTANSFFQPGVLIQKKDDDAPAPSPRPVPIDEAKKRQIMEGNYADDGDYNTFSVLSEEEVIKKTGKPGKQVEEKVMTPKMVHESRFQNDDLEGVRKYLDQYWAPKIDVKKASGGGGDTKTRELHKLPDWVIDYQGKLAAQKPEDFKPKSFEKDAATKYNPDWNDDSVLAQRLVEAFLRAWHKKLIPDSEVPSNIAELYKRVGSSEKEFGNARSTLLGDPNVFGWCGPATYNAVVLGLFKNHLRFKTGKSPITADNLRPGVIKSSGSKSYKPDETALNRQAFMAEINMQASFLIGNAKSDSPSAGYLKGDRVLSGKAAYTAPLAPGDIITQALMNGSPLSGHVLTVIREIPVDKADLSKPGTPMSTIYGISGNAGSIGGGSVRIEEFTREVPPENLQADLTKFSIKGNAFTVAKSLHASIEKQVKSDIISKEKIAPAKVSADEVKAGVEAAKKQQLDTAGEQLAKDKAAVLEATTYTFEALVANEVAMRQAKTRTPDQLKMAEAFSKFKKEKKSVYESLMKAQGTIKAINDYTALPESSQKDSIPFDTTSPLYNLQVGGMGRFRPNEKGHMWTTTIIKASQYTDAAAIQKDISAHDTQTFNQVLGGTISMDQFTEEMKKYKEQQLGGKGLEPMEKTVNELWPGAMEAIEGEGLAAEQGPDGRVMRKE